MSIWTNAKGAKPTGAGRWLPSGFRGTVRIERCQHKTDGFKGDNAFIVDFTILTSNRADVELGATYNWYQGRLTDPKIGRTAIGDVFAFVGACSGLDVMNDAENAQISASIDDVVSEGNPLMGFIVAVETIPKATQKGGEFTKHIWSAAEET